MINLKDFNSFRVEESVLNITKDMIESLTSYRTLISLGFKDVTTDRVWKNQNLTFEHDRSPYQFGITNTGYIRRIPRGGTPGVIKSFPSIQSVQDWENILGAFLRYGVKNVLGIGTNFELNYDYSKYPKLLSYVFRSGGLENYRFFLSFYDKLTPEQKNETSELIGMPEEEFLKIARTFVKVDKLIF